jgi:hypothetical protein
MSNMNRVISRRSGLGLLVLLMATLSVPAIAEDFAALKSRLMDGDFAIDFKALRLAYAKTPSYRPNSPNSLNFRRKMEAELRVKKYAEALTLGEAWLNEDYVNPFAHMGVAHAHQALGHVEQARFHNRILEGLYNSICAVGQGLTSDHPCQVLSVDEELFYLGRNRFEVGAQYQVECAGKIPCDVYEARQPGSSELFDQHFDISLPMTYSQQHPITTENGPATGAKQP